MFKVLCKRISGLFEKENAKTWHYYENWTNLIALENSFRMMTKCIKYITSNLT